MYSCNLLMSVNNSVDSGSFFYCVCPRSTYARDGWVLCQGLFRSYQQPHHVRPSGKCPLIHGDELALCVGGAGLIKASPGARSCAGFIPFNLEAQWGCVLVTRALSQADWETLTEPSPLLSSPHRGNLSVSVIKSRLWSLSNTTHNSTSQWNTAQCNAKHNIERKLLTLKNIVF